MSSRDTFLAQYRSDLEQAVIDHNEDYGYGIERVPEVFGRMVAAIDRGSFNKDSRAFKATCKKLGIKHTYKAIADYLASEVA